jgi:hypothetical protein
MMELTIDIDTGGTIREWNSEIGSPRDRPVSPVLLFLASDIQLALRQGTTTWPNREALTVTESGYATATQDGRAYVYELFPARWSDPLPYEPVVYVGRWPD